MPKKIKNEVLTRMPQTPECLQGIARDHWNSIVPKYIADKVVCTIDVPILIFACQCWQKSQEAEKDSERFKAQSQYISIVSKFGATYKSRVQLEIDTKQKPVSKDTSEESFMEFD